MCIPGDSVLILGIPASMGLVMLAEPLARLLFERGAFTPDDTVRAARMIACYASGVWAYCALPVVVRGFYALGDHTTPVKTGIVAVVLNVSMNLTLIWPLGVGGLALATAICSYLQVGILLLLLVHHFQFSVPRQTLLGFSKTILATAVMGGIGLGCLKLMSPLAPNKLNDLLRIGVQVVVCSGVYIMVSRLTGNGMLALLFRVKVHKKS